MTNNKEIFINLQDLARLSLFNKKKNIQPETLESFTQTYLEQAKEKIISNDILKVEADRLDKAFKKLCLLLHINYNNFKKDKQYSFELSNVHYLLKILIDNDQYNLLIKNGTMNVMRIEDHNKILDLLNFIENCIKDQEDYNNALSIFALKFELNDTRFNPITRMATILFRPNSVSFKEKKRIYDNFINEVDEIAYNYIGDFSKHESDTKDYNNDDLFDNRIIMTISDARKILNPSTTNTVSYSYYSELINKVFVNPSIDTSKLNRKDADKQYDKLIVKQYKTDLVKEIKKALKEVEQPKQKIFSNYIKIDKRIK